MFATFGSNVCTLEEMSVAPVAATVEDLAKVVGTLAIAPEPAELEAALRLVDRLQAILSAALGEFGSNGGWEHDGSLSLTAWLAAHGRELRRDAHREAVTARRLQSLPLTSSAWQEGSLSTGQLRAVMANVPARYLGLYAEQEAELVPALEGLTAGETAAAMRHWRLVAEALDDDGPPADRPSELRMSETLDGRREVSGHFRPEDAAIVEAALAEATAPLAPGEPRRPGPEQRAEALVEICRQFLDSAGRPDRGKRSRPYINVVIDLEHFAGGGPGRMADGTWVSPDVVSFLSCDSELHRLVMAGRSTVLDYGRTTRTISPALWSALVVRDRHCRHPGCDRPPRWCEGHHVVHYSQGGPTCLSNICLACTRHHHLWHEPGWELELAQDATLTIITPWGEKLTSKPPP